MAKYRWVKSYARMTDTHELPTLIEVQLDSFRQFQKDGVLDLFDEMAFIADHYAAVEPEQILAMATVNGAAALQQPGLGRLDTGWIPQMVYIPLSCTSKQQLIETITHKGFDEPCRPLFRAGGKAGN